MLSLLLTFLSTYLIEFMTALLCCALLFRYLAYRHSRIDDAYFSKFTREIDTNIEADKSKGVAVDHVDDYLSSILGRVADKLPQDSVRFSTKKVSRSRTGGQAISLRDYVGGKHGLIASIQSESSVFHSKSQPDFDELTERVLSDDKNWMKLYGTIPIDAVSRMIDVLPSMFIVFGILGTFIGISMALPEIAHIDFNDLEGSGETINQFVIKVTFAMKTSIAGIFFSIILTFLNTLFPIQEMREKTFNKIASSLQALWYHIQNDSIQEMELRKIQPEILETLKSILGHLKVDKKKDVA